MAAASAAVCLKCGNLKTSASALCPECGYLPVELEDRARHEMLTDRYYHVSQLEEFSAKVRAGEPLSFDPAAVSEMAAKLTAEQDLAARQARNRRVVGLVAVLLAVILAALVLVSALPR